MAKELADPSTFFARPFSTREIIERGALKAMQASSMKTVEDKPAAPSTPALQTSPSVSTVTASVRVSPIQLESSPPLPNPNLKKSLKAMSRPLEGCKDMNLATRVFAIEQSHEDRISALETKFEDEVSVLKETIKRLELQTQAGARNPTMPEISPPATEDGSVTDVESGETEAVNHTKAGDSKKQKSLSEMIAQEWGFKEVDAEQPPMFGGDNHNTHANSQAAPTQRWMPAGVRYMPQLAEHHLDMKPRALDELKPFSATFLAKYFGGSEYANGLYSHARTTANQIRKLLPSKTYYMIDATIDPFVPQTPGEHGAKLCVIMRDLPDERMVFNVPLFVALPNGSESQQQQGEKQYYYMGHYTQSRWSDRLDYDRMREVVPPSVISYWAEKLGADADMSGWQLKEVMRVLYPKPEFHGLKPEGDFIDAMKNEAGSNELNEDLRHYFEAYEDWVQETEGIKKTLTPQTILDAFERADLDYPVGLRFWWEYLECVGFNRNFYYIVSQAMDEMKKSEEEDSDMTDA